MRALVSSGRSDLVSSCPVTLRGPCPAPRRRVSTGAAAARRRAASNAVVRTVSTLIGSFDCTVANALPA